MTTDLSDVGNDNSAVDVEAEFVPANEGAFSVEHIIDRLAQARDDATRLSNRFSVFALVFLGLALIKLAKLDISLTFIGVDAGKVQYGLFIFIVASQICSMLGTSRIMDSRAYDYQIEQIAKVEFPRHFKEALRTVPNAHEWLSPSSEVLESISGHRFAKFVYNAAMIATGVLALGFVFGPNVAGIYYLYNHEELITEGDKGLQYWIVLGVTVLSIMWSFAYFAIHAMTEHDVEDAGDGN